jgi:ABC transporter substrate binding protein
MRRREFIAVPLALHSVAKAQQPTTPIVGFLSFGAAETSAFLSDFRRGLAERGYIEGKNLTIEYRWAERYDQLPSLAADLVNRGVTVLFASPLSGGLAAKNATRSIPIVFSVGGDPINFGLVDSLNKPGGNVTGISQLNQGLVPKRLELLREALPNVRCWHSVALPKKTARDPEADSSCTGAIGVNCQRSAFLSDIGSVRIVLSPFLSPMLPKRSGVLPKASLCGHESGFPGGGLRRSVSQRRRHFHRPPRP